MDIGNAAYTEFDMSPDVISYMAENPELLDCQMGLIHSHNNMATFFSGTDQDTLREEGNDRVNFVSLIVNNAGNYTAAITRKKVITQKVEECTNYEFFNEGIKSECDEYEVKDEVIEWCYLKVDKKEYTFDDMHARLEEIRERKRRQAAKAPVKVVNYESHPQAIKCSKILKTGISEDPTLFDDLPEEIPGALAFSEDIDTSFANTTFMDLPFGKVKFNEDTVKAFVRQIILGSVLISSKSKIDLNDWVKKMPEIYRNRFGDDVSNQSSFDCWAESLIEYLIWDVTDPVLEKKGYDMDEIAGFLAYDIIQMLLKLPQNKYIKVFIEKLKKYIEL